MKHAHKNLALWQAAEYSALSSVARTLVTLATECDNCGKNTFGVMLRAMSTTILEEGQAIDGYNKRHNSQLH